MTMKCNYKEVKDKHLEKQMKDLLHQAPLFGLTLLGENTPAWCLSL